MSLPSPPARPRPYPAGGDKLWASSLFGGPVAKVHHSAIATRDVEASLLFWRDGIGLEVLMDHEFEGPWPELFGARARILRSVFLGEAGGAGERHRRARRLRGHCTLPPGRRRRAGIGPRRGLLSPVALRRARHRPAPTGRAGRGRRADAGAGWPGTTGRRARSQRRAGGADGRGWRGTRCRRSGRETRRERVRRRKRRTRGKRCRTRPALAGGHHRRRRRRTRPGHQAGRVGSPRLRALRGE